MQDYHQLDIWQRGMSDAVALYRFSARLLDIERYNLGATAEGRDLHPAEHC
jgi:hypothetical protein